MITLIDGSNMLHRSMYNVDNKIGVHPIRDLYIRFMACQPNTIVVWDGMHSNKRRRDLYPGYKQRPEKAEDIAAAFDITKEVLCHCPVMQIEIPYWEADDVLYSLALDYIENSDNEVTIETNDQDFWQLADEPRIKLPLVKPLPCDPEHTCLFKAIIGDKSDTIPGWKGFGPVKWEAMSGQLDIMLACLEQKNWESWQDLSWPKGITPTEESFFQCCIYYQVVTMLRVPEEDFNGNYICGKPHPALAEEIFARWRI